MVSDILGSGIKPTNDYQDFKGFIRGGMAFNNKPQDTENHEDKSGWTNSPLDLLSTSQTFSPPKIPKSREKPSLICENNAPYFALKTGIKTYKVVQGCCNNWNCSRCGIQRAKKEYGRFVRGCETLSENHELWFITLTCRGREMSLEDAELGYLEWTNRAFTRWRTYATRHNQEWYYASVTERQKRGHPHSHIITTWRPPDITTGARFQRRKDGDSETDGVWKTALRSEYIARTCADVGLGDQYDISRVRSAEAASRYVAKYLFKPANFKTIWPKGWRRVRYSQNWPELPEMQTDAFVLISREDWHKLATLAVVVKPDNEYTWQECLTKLRGHDTIVEQNN